MSINAGKAVSKEKYFELIGYAPHARQRLFHDSKARFKIPVCGRRFGKTWMGAREVEPLLMLPNKHVWIVGPTYDLGEKEFRVIWDDMIVKLGLGREKTVRKTFNKRAGDMAIYFPWNTRLEVRSADRPETLVGEKLDYVIMSEAAKHSKETWDRFIRPALADNRGSATFSTTPEGQNWIHDLWQLGRNPLFEDYDSWRFPAWENNILYPGGREDPEIMLMERTMPGEWFLQEIAADFTSFMGKIYGEWDEVTHVLRERYVYNPAWKNYIAFDWGFVNPMAAIEFQVDPMDRIYIWREHYRQGVILETFLHEMKSRQQPEGYKIDLCFGDSASPAAVSEVCRKFGPCLADPRSKEDWMEGINLVKRFLATQTVGTADEFGTPVDVPWLVVDPSCANTIREFNNYRAIEAGGNRPRNPREDALKYDNHAMDAIRYGLMHIFKLGCTMSLASVLDSNTMTDLPEHGYFTSNVSFV